MGDDEGPGAQELAAESDAELTQPGVGEANHVPMPRSVSSESCDNGSMRADQQVVMAAEAALQAAAAVHRAIQNGAAPRDLKSISAVAVQAAETALLLSQEPRRERQPAREFLDMMTQEAKEMVEEHVQEGVRYTERTLRQAKSIIEDHFHIDEAFRLLGPLRQDANWARDVHDWFNLVALLPVIVLNVANWGMPTDKSAGLGLPDFWTGDAFQLFWWTTFCYFVADLAWMVLIPTCVRSPGVIIKHHVVTLAYILVPFLHPEYGWIMGACMIVEINTWFLIARRSFNKSGVQMWGPGVSVGKSIRLTAVSICFYISWFVIRLAFYPYLLLAIVREWIKYSKIVGTPLNLIAITPVMQCVFIVLNFKWTVDLVRSKSKGRGPSKGL